MTLRQRLTGSYIYVALAGLLLASLAGAVLARTFQVRAAERSVRLLTAVVASGVEAPIEDRLPNVAALEQLAHAEGVRLLLVEPDGTVHQDSQNSLEDDKLPVGDLLSEEAINTRVVRQLDMEGESYFISPVPLEAEDNRRLLVAIKSGSLLDAWYWLLPMVIALCALGTLAAWVAGSQIAQRIARPVEALKVAADKITEGDYEVRVDAPLDITELQTLSKSFNMMADEVRSARQTQRDFLANVSHDLRTPLTSIQGFSQALMDGAVPEEQGARVAGIIYNEATRLSRLVQDLLDLARIEAGRFSMVQRDINLKTVLERCSEKFKPQAESLGVTFESKITKRALPVHGDADRLEQVVTNLIDNAITYAQDGG
ncbi:MAG: HAMP domain-containing histidine kinase, partial [Ardenticatenales bacterium]|nr:HAMP domain-containing histidine kinase [Ardenticatenales bacterium]